MGNCDTVKDLGVYIDKRLSFNYHVEEICKASLKALGFISRTTKNFHNIPCLIALYNAFVRSRLDYAALVWSPFYSSHEQRLENVQRRFLKLLFFKEDGIYPPQGYDHGRLLKRWNFLSLKDNRLRSSIIFLYKLSNCLLDSPSLLGELCWHVPSVNTRMKTTFYTKTPSTVLASRAPLHRACCSFNDISRQTDLDLFHNSLQSFKGHLDTHFFKR